MNGSYAQSKVYMYDFMLGGERPLRAEGRDQGLKQHWVDFPGRRVTGMKKAQQKKLIGSVAVDESLLTQASVRALMAQCADSAVAKSEVRLKQRFEDRLAGVETSMGSLESTVASQWKAVAQELKSEIQQSRKGKGGGDRKGKNDNIYKNDNNDITILCHCSKFMI